jgi:hypothetical protein
MSYSLTALCSAATVSSEKDPSPLDSAAPPAERPCLCCTTLETPLVTLTTEFVHYLRCPTCGFIWTASLTRPALTTIV